MRRRQLRDVVADTDLRSRFAAVLVLLSALLLAACSMVQPKVAELGSEQNPIKLAFGPSADAPKVLAASQELTRALERETGLRFKLLVPTSQAAAIEGLGTTSIDIAWLSPLAYVQAHQTLGAEPLLTGLRDGSPTSAGQIIVRADSGINTLEALRGKRFAYVDQSSAFGYLYPKAAFRAAGIDVKGFFAEVTFAGSDEKVLTAVYNRQVDGGATLGDALPGGPRDPRLRLQEALPGILNATRIIGRTPPSPNDAICVRTGVLPTIVDTVRDGLLRVSSTDVGQKALHDLYGADGVAAVTDADFEPVRQAAQALNVSPDQDVTPTRPPK
jgi:phosphonate transport system substrate-binding protein